MGAARTLLAPEGDQSRVRFIDKLPNYRNDHSMELECLRLAGCRMHDPQRKVGHGYPMVFI